MSEPDFTAIADRLFGASSTPSTGQSQPQAPESPSSVDTAARQADEARKASFNEHGPWGPAAELPKVQVPDAVRELRGTPERRMYNSDVFATALKTADSIERASPPEDLKAMAGIDLSPEQRAALAPVVARELHAIYTDAGLTQQEADLVERVIVDVRTAKINEDPATDAANAQEAARQLVERYGNEAEAALADARAFIARDPRIAKMMDMSRAGNDPRMVMLAVEAARRARARGEKF